MPAWLFSEKPPVPCSPAGCPRHLNRARASAAPARGWGRDRGQGTATPRSCWGSRRTRLGTRAGHWGPAPTPGAARARVFLAMALAQWPARGAPAAPLLPHLLWGARGPELGALSWVLLPPTLLGCPLCPFLPTNPKPHQTPTHLIGNR